MRRILMKTSLCAVLAFAALGTGWAADAITIDASSDQAASDSFKRMVAALPSTMQEDLMSAMIKINMDGVGSAAEMLADPTLRNPTIVRIKDRVAGMTAEEILAEADVVTSVRMVMPDREP